VRFEHNILGGGGMKFRPCPFCGNEQIDMFPHDKRSNIVQCRVCKAAKLVVSNIAGQIEAEWNYRPAEAKLKSAIREAESVAAELARRAQDVGVLTVRHRRAMETLKGLR
jgi:hypothetical protein